MEKQKIIEKIKAMKEEGFTYKAIANRIGLKQTELYTFIHRDSAYKRIHAILEEYFKEEK